MEEKVDIVALGELLIDFTEAGHRQDGENTTSERKNWITLLKKGKIFHFGSLSLTDEPAKVQL